MAEDRDEGELVVDDTADTDAPAPLTREDLGPDADRNRERVRAVLALVAALVVGVIIGRVTAPDDGDGGTEDPETATPETIPFPAGDVNRTNYWGFANLEPVTIDTFDRADDPESLGQAGTEQRWEVVAGTWGIRGEEAATTGGAEGGPNLAVVPGGRGDGLTEVLMTVVEPGAGLVFRYQDANNFWAVTADPGTGSWVVNRVIDGTPEEQGRLTGPTADGTTVSVTQDGTTLRFLLDGTEYLSLTDGALRQALQGGLIAANDTTGDARWDRFLLERFRDRAEPEG